MANTKITAANIDSTSTGITLADLTVDTTTLVVDATNNRVGIGTASPASTLEVNNTSAGDTVATFEGDYGAGGDVQLVRYERGGGAVYGAISYKDATTDMEFGNISSHALSFITANTRRLTIDSNGDIGINTSSPIDGSKLDVVDSDDMTMRVRSTGSSSAAIRFQNSTTGTTTNDGLFVGIGTDETGYVWHYDNNPLAFATNNTERMRIDSNGQVMIGHTSSFAHADADNLAIGDGTNNSGLTIYTGSDKESSIIFGNTGTNGNIEAGIKYYHESHGTVANRRAMTFATGGSMTERMRIDSSGDLLINGTSRANGYPERFLTLSMQPNSGEESCPIIELVGNRTTNAGNQNGMIQFYNKTGTQTEVSRISSIQGSAAVNGELTFQIAHGSTLTEAMRISSVGNVTKPLQCNFLARRNGNQSGYNASGAYGDGVRYNSEIYDIGGDFDVTTGIFTAPVDGTYLIQGSVYSNTAGTNWSQAWLAINGARANYTDMVTADGNTFISTTHLVKLSAGDEVRYHPYYSGSTSVTILDNANHTWFKGYLLG